MCFMEWIIKKNIDLVVNENEIFFYVDDTKSYHNVMVMTSNNNINTSKITILSFEIKIFSHISDTSN